MSVVIQNMGWTNAPPPARHDECLYALRINHTTLAGFTHSRAAGLATCLRLAADALETNEYETPEEVPDKLLSDAERTVRERKLREAKHDKDN